MTSRGGWSWDSCFSFVGCLLLLLQTIGFVCALQAPSSSSFGNCCRPSQPLYKNRCTHAPSYHRRSSSTLYFSSAPGQESEKNSSSVTPNVGGTDDNDKKKKWARNLRNRFTLPTIQSTKRAILSFIKLLINSPSAFKVYYSKLTRRGRLAVSLQLLMLGLALGMGINSSYRDNATRLAANRPVEVSYSTFLDLVAVNGKGHTPGKNPALLLDSVIISKDKIAFRIISDMERHASALLDKKLVKTNDVSTRPIPLVQRTIYTVKPYASDELISTLHDHDVPFRAASTHNTANTIIANVTRLSIFAIYMLFLRRMYQTMSGGGNGGKNGEVPGKLATFNNPNDSSTIINFDDIEGIDNAKYEVMELVDTLCNPSKYEIMGARAPKGLLLEGPPGTGKTMLARATAATAGVPLLYCSGSDFVEMFVGRGAARVRNTFSRAAKLSPCIIFIDELDALGKSRDMGGFGSGMRSNDEAEQTLNQLLACMDGLDSTKRICVLAATNRKEILDPALIRPGRFDRIIKVTLPDVFGRERILRVHAKKLPGFTECKGIDEKRSGSLGMGASVDLSAVAAVTRGLCGADLEFIVNEAAIRAVRRVSAKLRSGVDPAQITPCVSAKDFEDSVFNFYEMRKPKGGVGDLLSNVLGKGFE